MVRYHEDSVLNFLISETHKSLENDGWRYVTADEADPDEQRREQWASPTMIGPMVLSITYPRHRQPGRETA